MHAPAWQVRPPLHAAPHAPQWLASDVASTSQPLLATPSQSRRPTSQVTAHAPATQVADALQEILTPRGVIVVIEAEHLCMAMRGIRKPGATTTTSAVRGLFKTSAVSRGEALDLIFR